MHELSEDHGIPWTEALPSLLDLFPQNVCKYPDHLALVCTHQEADLYNIPNTPAQNSRYQAKPYLRWTYKNFYGGLLRLIDGLEAHGVQEGTAIFTFLSNSAEATLLFWASLFMQCTFVPINPRSLQNKEEVRHMINTAWSTCSSRRGIFVADTDDVADQIMQLKIQDQPQLFVRDSSSSSHLRYPSFAELVNQKQFNELTPTTPHTGEQSSIILFTSGTTSLPKGCSWNLELLSRFAFLRQKATKMLPEDDVLCLPVPNNHAMNTNFQVTAFCAGATIVFAGPTFAAGHALETMHQEKVTHSILVPTMVHAMIAESNQYGGKISSLKSVLVAGDAVTPEVLTACQEILGSDMLEGTFGMTEGVLIFGGSSRNKSHLIREHGTAVGRANMGTTLRICSPENKPVPRGTAGELHYTGTTLFEGYIGQDTPEFYTGDDGRKWFKTGDQAIMDKDGYIFIIGRFKENIIRGGENVSPAAIEAVLAREPKLASLNIVIVAAPDEIAGQVPVAIVQKRLDDETAQAIQNTVVKNMGPQFMPDQVLSIQELGLEELPKTMAGKIQKTKLKERVYSYYKERDQVVVNGHEDSSHLRDVVQQIWKHAVGHDVAEDALIIDFADSITLMRVRDRVAKATGKNISLSEMIHAGTMSGQIQLLSQAKPSATDSGPRRKVVRQRQGPITTQDILPFATQPKYFEGAKAAINEKLWNAGLSWNDVEAVSPASDFIQILAQDGTLDSWIVTSAVIPNQKMTSSQMRSAFESTMANNPMLGSFLVWDQESFGSAMALHVIPIPTKKVFDICIVDGGKLASPEDLKAKCLGHVEKTNALFPGPLFHATIFEIQSTGTAAALFVASHGVLDGSSGPLMFEDLDRALGGMQLDKHIDYDIWTDTYFALKSSHEAQNAVSWHVKRVKGITAHRNDIYPPRKGNELPCELPSKLECSFSAPNVVQLRQANREITAPVILKTAFTLALLFRTGHSHALYGNLEAARARFPFVPQALEMLEGHHFEASDVSGVTLGAVLNLVEMKSNQTVISFLGRMQEDQANLTKYASAPMLEIFSQIGEKDSRAMLDVLEWIQFNWAPGMGATGSDPYSNMELVNAGGRVSMMGLLINAGLGGDDTSTFFLKIRSSILPMEELKRFAHELELITKWLVNPRNWDRTVGLYKEALGA